MWVFSELSCLPLPWGAKADACCGTARPSVRKHLEDDWHECNLNGVMFHASQTSVRLNVADKYRMPT